MDIYQLDYILHEPEESEGWMYLAEVPTLQGCMAWGGYSRRCLEEPSGSRPEHHPAPEGKRGTAARGDNPPAQPRRQPDRNRMTYREIRRKLEILGCRFQRQADGSHELWVNRQTGGGPHPQAREPDLGHRHPPPNSQKPGNLQVRIRPGIGRSPRAPPLPREFRNFLIPRRTQRRKPHVWSAPRAGIIFLLRQVRTKRKITA